MDKIYTGNGDRGYTKTLSNFRISKSDAVVELLGCTDEFTAALAAANADVSDAELKKYINAVIKRMKEIKREFSGGQKTVTDECVKTVEGMIDRLGEKTAGTGGPETEKSRAASMLCLAAAIAKRLERAAVKAGQYNRLGPAVLSYMNRLCDLIEAFADYQETLDNEKDAGVRNNTGKRDLSPSAEGEVKNMAETALTLSLAKKLSEVIERKAASDGVRVVVAIVDAGANLILLHATDDAYIASVQIARDKAYTSVALKMFTHTALELSRGGALDGLDVTSANGLCLLGGGAPLKIGDRIVGGLGVSGGTAEEDTGFAVFGAECMKFLTE
ncbi:MAG: heme-binding protein [Oscillospiraceae bacterium]|nr:heme-binding protein [Oscillospiraceae bacterium]